MQFKIILFLTIFGFNNYAFSQIKDTVAFLISKEETKEINYSLYNVVIKNFTDSPICILHSAYNNLFYDPPQRLALIENDKFGNQYSLHYTARDTSNVYENTNSNYNGEVILPMQEIQFRLLIPLSNKESYLQFEYIIVSDFCYKSFKDNIFMDATKWYLNYKKLYRKVKLTS
jgi:hypothetical protein